VSSATTRSRPIINTRDEAHADTHRYRRLHIIVGDSNLAEPTLALKIGSTTLILEMIEAGFPNLPHLEFANNMAAIRTISRDLTGQTPIPTTTGTTTTALELQQRYLDAATEWLTHREETGGTTNTELTHTLNLWHTTLNAIKTGDITTIDHDIDWAIKLNLLTTYHTTLGLKPHNYNHPKLHQLNLAYHDIRPGRGLHRLLETKNRINRITTPETVTHATTNPPPTTRAALRGTFLHHATYHHAPFAVDWLRLKINRPEPQIVELTDPFANTDPRVDELIKYLETHSHYYQEP
jgi:pup--protein ligase